MARLIMNWLLAICAGLLIGGTAADVVWVLLGTPPVYGAVIDSLAGYGYLVLLLLAILVCVLLLIRGPGLARVFASLGLLMVAGVFLGIEFQMEALPPWWADYLEVAVRYAQAPAAIAIGSIGLPVAFRGIAGPDNASGSAFNEAH